MVLKVLSRILILLKGTAKLRFVSEYDYSEGVGLIRGRGMAVPMV